MLNYAKVFVQFMSHIQQQNVKIHLIICNVSNNCILIENKIQINCQALCSQVSTCRTRLVIIMQFKFFNTRQISLY